MRDLATIKKPPELSDGRLRLRALRPRDRAAVVRACNDPEVERWCFRIPYPYHERDFDAWLAGTRRSWRRERTANWAVTDATTDELLGAIGLTVVTDREAGEIGYWTAPWARGGGVMTAAARLVRDWAFDVLELARLELTTDVDNVASQRTAERLGFRREGVLRSYLAVRGARRDHVAYGLLADDPRS